MKDPKKCIILVPTHSTIDPQCDAGLRELERRGYRVDRVFGCAAIDHTRSRLASVALASGFDEIMWIDSDIGFHPNEVDKLRTHGLPISCGLYVKRDGQDVTFKLLPGDKALVFGKPPGLKEVLHAGFGFVHTRREVYQSIKSTCNLPDCNREFGPPVTPYFIPELVQHGQAEWWYLAEDTAFCHRARKCGYKIMADTTVFLSHVGRHPFTWKDLQVNRPQGITIEPGDKGHT
jgi:hypothetical protein